MPDKALSSDSVNRRFRFIVSIIYIVVLTLVLGLFIGQWHGYRDASEAQREFVVLQAALRAMADISAERQPTFARLDQGEPISARRIKAMMEARRTTDADMEELGTVLKNPRCKNCASLLPTYNKVAAILSEAREDLDAIKEQKATDRVDTDVLRAFDHMGPAVPLLSSIVDRGAMGVIRENADVQSYLLAARLAGLLREQAGQLASQFVPSLSSHRALTADEAYDIARVRGSIDQLRVLLAPSVHGLPPWLQSHYDEITEHYFGDGLAYIDHLRTAASLPGGADVSLTELAERYGPLITPIERFRDDALTLARDTIRSSLHWHLILLIGAALLASALTGVLILMSWRFREKIVRPFVDARRLILAIAAGDLSMAIPQAGYSGEIKDLFGALGVLKQNSAERIRLEKERKRLIGELRTMAETDPLTGLLNRRAFESRARVLLSDKRGHEPDVALIMLDIDHFKHVNDTYGHETGDRALTKLAAVCREIIRSDDVLARIGGEEFVILLRVPDHVQAYELAQRLRNRLHQETIVATDGESFGITASFGIAFARRADLPDAPELMRQADALLYQAKENGRDRIETGATV
ncbi:diguanylate cyclase [Dyella sp. 20L07]|uniref:GGDEF domain-containing protein n=1 Tax=Dyella sp. 20L07 TaxID=3384240 RepID=UPI003D299B12